MRIYLYKKFIIERMVYFMQEYEYEVIEKAMNIFGQLLTIGLIGFLNLIFTICAMFVISQDAQKRKIKCWHWNLILFLFFPSYLSFIVVIFYIVFACGNNPIIESGVVIDVRSNDNSNNQNRNYNNISSRKGKTKSYPRYLLFYAIAQLVSLCISFGAIFDVMDEIIDIIKLDEQYEEFLTTSEITIIEPNTKHNYVNPDKNHKNSNNFSFQNIKIADDIEDYAMNVFSSNTERTITSVDNTNSTNFYTFDASLSSPSGNDIVQFFSDNLVKIKGFYKYPLIFLI